MTKHSQMTLSIVFIISAVDEVLVDKVAETYFQLGDLVSIPPGGLVRCDYAKPLDTSMTQKKVNKGCFDQAAEVTLISRSFFTSIFFLSL